jgi:hypothetical protein
VFGGDGQKPRVEHGRRCGRDFHFVPVEVGDAGRDRLKRHAPDVLILTRIL